MREITPEPSPSEFTLSGFTCSGGLCFKIDRVNNLYRGYCLLVNRIIKEQEAESLFNTPDWCPFFRSVRRSHER